MVKKRRVAWGRRGGTEELGCRGDLGANNGKEKKERKGHEVFYP